MPLAVMRPRGADARYLHVALPDPAGIRKQVIAPVSVPFSTLPAPAGIRKQVIAPFPMPFFGVIGPGRHTKTSLHPIPYAFTQRYRPRGGIRKQVFAPVSVPLAFRRNKKIQPK